MSLSNMERINGIYECIAKITKLGRELKQSISVVDEDKYSPLAELTGQLWDSFLGKMTEAEYWLFGGTASNPIMIDHNSPWCKGIKLSLIRSLTEEQDDYERYKLFSPFDGHLDISSLLMRAGKTYSYTYEIYDWTERLSYFLRRYDDAFLEEHIKLSELVSKILGECFSIFCSEEVYARAYLLHRICELIYDGCYYKPEGETDVVSKWLYEHAVHHDLSSVMHYEHPTVSELVDYLKTLLECYRTERFLFERLIVAIKIARRKYHYERQHKELLSMLREAEWEDDKIEQIEGLLKECRKEYEQRKEKEAEKGKKDFVRREIQLLEYIRHISEASVVFKKKKKEEEE